MGETSELSILLAERQRRQELQILLAERERRRTSVGPAQPQQLGIPAPPGSVSAAPGSPPSPEQAIAIVTPQIQQLQAQGRPSLEPSIPIGQDPRGPGAEVLGVPAREFGQIPGAQAAREAGELVTGEFGATTGGEAVGRIAGATVGGPVGAAIGGAIGSAASLGISRLARGEQVETGEIALEFGLSALPDVVAKPLARAGRRILGATRPGREAAGDIGAQFLRERAFPAFDPPNKEVVDTLFDNVRQSGALLSPSQLRRPFREMGDETFKQVKNTLNRIPAPPGKESEGFGRGVAEAFQRIRDGKPAPGLDLGALQHVTSQLKKQSFGKKEGALVDALETMAQDLDDAIIRGRFIRGAEQSPLLINARSQFRQLKEAEDFQALVNKRSITRTSKGGTRLQLDLGKLADTIDNPSTKLEQAAVRALNRNPAAKREMTDFIRNMKRVNIDGGALPKESLINAVGIIFQNRAARTRFNALVRNNNNVATEEMVAFLANAARRGVIGAGQDPTATALVGQPETLRVDSGAQ